MDADVEENALMKYLHDNIIGNDAVFSGPYGLRKVLYCDYIASGKPLKCIEDFIRSHVMPMYGNTHTTTSVTSLQTILYRQEARDIIRNAVRASEHDAVIFTGNGVTGAVHKLINALNFAKPPVVFCGPFEHHSNLLPWKEVSAHMVRITEAEDGNVNVAHLEAALKSWKDVGLPMIGCFSAASNVTGQLTDTIDISIMLHRYNAIAVWDYATAAPYVEIDMHPVVENGDASKDAIFMSPHKFAGGVGTPGVLVAAKRLFRNPVPTDHGGGSVFFVSEEKHRFLKDYEMREEGGTPDIIGAIRAGLSFKLKEEISCKAIMKRESVLFKKVMGVWSKITNLEILGSSNKEFSNNERLSIFSFLIRHHDSGWYLHYSFVAAVLNDVFGIQARGGCACAGPYAQDLLGISQEKVKKFEKALLEDSRLDRRHLRRFKEYSPHEVLRPGFVRLSIPYFATDEEADFVINAVKMVAESAWMLLPKYMFDPETGEWKHVKQRVFKDRKWLGHVKFTPSGLTFKEPKLDDSKRRLSIDFNDCLLKARDIFDKARKSPEPFLPDHDTVFDKSVEELRWFLTPSEAQSWLTKLQGRKGAELKHYEPSFSVRTVIRQLTEDEVMERVEIPNDFGIPIGNSLKSHVPESVGFPTNGKVTQKPLTNGVDGTSIDDSSSNETESNGFVTPDVQLSANGDSQSLLNSEITPSVEDKTLAMNGSSGHELVDENVTEIPFGRDSKSRDAENGGSKIRFIPPPKRLMKLTIQAIDEFNMIRNGDRVLVCLSGGKDSLSLLHTLRQYQFYSKKQNVEFELGAVTVDPKTASYDPSPLITYLAALGLPYFFEEQSILQQALALPEVTSICAFCSRMKRGRLYHCARREKWNVLAMGQHLDDLAESFLMSMFQNGLLRTMKASYAVKEGDLRVIRPFVYVREKDTREFAESSNLPIIPENCPACFEAPKERHRMKQLLAAQELVHPKLFYSIKEALKPLMSKNQTGMESGEFLIDSEISPFDDD